MKYAVGSFVLAAVLLAGCSAHGSSASSPVVPGPGQVSSIGINDDGIDLGSTAVAVGIRLTGEAPFNSARYGTVLGYFKGKTSTTSQVVTLPTATNVRFFNLDSVRPHTMSFLGNATRHGASFPSLFNGSSTQSPAGTAIGTTNFSTGPLNPGTKSLLYTTGLPGFYMVGCAFHYNSNGMRTVIIVK